jgi:hypothetical protein
VLGGIFRDPAVRRAYLTTKLAVVVLAAAATWPLSRLIGTKAWVGFAVFAALMAALAAAVLGLGGSVAAAADGGDEAADDDEPDPAHPVVLAVEDALDLHSFPPADVPEVVADYLSEAVARGFREVRLIHGRGIGVQRERVRSLLARHPDVVEFFDAPPERGGWGATVAVLRPR